MTDNPDVLVHSTLILNIKKIAPFYRFPIASFARGLVGAVCIIAKLLMPVIIVWISSKNSTSKNIRKVA